MTSYDQNSTLVKQYDLSVQISNTGCYATCVQLLVAPLLPHLPIDSIAQPTVFGISGYSGAGTLSATSPDGEPVTVPKVDPAGPQGAFTDHPRCSGGISVGRRDGKFVEDISSSISMGLVGNASGPTVIEMTVEVTTP